MQDRESRAVLNSTRMLLQAVRGQAGLAYADDTCSPISDITLGIVARRMGCALRVDDLGPDFQEFGLPGYLGPPMIVINRRIDPGLRRCALRHGLAHLVAGELEVGQGSEVRFMSSILDYMSLEERRAALFALADLIPDRQLSTIASAAYSSLDIKRWLIQEIRPYARGWPEERLRDRALLREGLYGTL